MGFVRNKSLFAKFFIAILISHTFIQNFNSHPNTIVAGYESGLNPGMMIRLEASTLNAFKKAMEKFLPHYINFDANLPTHYHYDFGVFFNLF